MKKVVALCEVDLAKDNETIFQEILYVKLINLDLQQEDIKMNEMLYDIKNDEESKIKIDHRSDVHSKK